MRTAASRWAPPSSAPPSPPWRCRSTTTGLSIVWRDSMLREPPMCSCLRPTACKTLQSCVGWWPALLRTAVQAAAPLSSNLPSASSLILPSRYEKFICNDQKDLQNIISKPKFYWTNMISHNLSYLFPMESDKWKVTSYTICSLIWVANMLQSKKKQKLNL